MAAFWEYALLSHDNPRYLFKLDPFHSKCIIGYTANKLYSGNFAVSDKSWGVKREYQQNKTMQNEIVEISHHWKNTVNLITLLPLVAS